MAGLPAGTVTFLFTDIEGSTRLWEEHPDAMRSALARHDEILRDAVESHDGHVVKTTGDGVHAAFGRAHDAVDAAVLAQRALGAQDWAVGPLRVRMGIHTGEAESRGGDYFGPALNRAARLMAAGHGDQILVSLATEEVVGESLPRDLNLVDLGEHRLRDLARPHRVFQVVGPDLRREFPPVRSLDAFTSNLPSRLTSFVGRDADLRGIAKCLEETRLVTITGPGGVGKTRLAIQVAADVLPRFRDGVWLCELAAVADAAALEQVVATALGVNPRQGLTMAESIGEHLRPKQLLLLLDNCEHLVATAAALADHLTQACPSVKVLATSRELLAVDGEQAWPLRPLGLPVASSGLQQVAETEAVRLFLDRAHAARPEFALDATTVASVTEICQRLDGMPLAIELAAARIAAIGASEIARLLDQRFRLLTGGARTAIDRHQTLRATVDWSYELLDPTERRVFDRLGAFAGGFDSNAAIGVVSGDGVERYDVLDALSSLVGKSMLSAEPTPQGTMRFELLETLRQYAREKLSAGSDSEVWFRRHAEYYSQLATECGVGMQGPHELEYRWRTHLERDDIRAATSWALSSDEIGDQRLGLRIIAALSHLTALDRAAGVAEWAALVLQRELTMDPVERFSVFAAAAWGALGLGDYETAVALAHQAIPESGELDPNTILPHLAYGVLGISASVRGTLDDAMTAIANGHTALERIGAGEFDHSILSSMGVMFQAAHGAPGAREQAVETLEQARDLGTPSCLVGALFAYAWANLDEPDVALPALDEGISLARAGANRSFLGVALAMSAQLRSSATPAVSLGALREALSHYQEHADQPALVTSLTRGIEVLVRLGYAETAAVIGGAVTGPLLRLAQVPRRERDSIDDALKQAHSQLGNAFDAALGRGSDMSYNDLVDYAESELDRLISETSDD